MPALGVAWRGHPRLHSRAEGRHGWPDKPGQDGGCYELSLLIGRRRGHDKEYQIGEPGVGDRVLDPGRQEDHVVLAHDARLVADLHHALAFEPVIDLLL